MKEEAKIIFAVGQSVEPKKNKSFLIGQCADFYKGYCGKYEDGCFHQCKEPYKESEERMEQDG